NIYVPMISNIYIFSLHDTFPIITTESVDNFWIECPPDITFIIIIDDAVTVPVYIFDIAGIYGIGTDQLDRYIGQECSVSIEVIYRIKSFCGQSPKCIYGLSGSS